MQDLDCQQGFGWVQIAARKQAAGPRNGPVAAENVAPEAEIASKFCRCNFLDNKKEFELLYHLCASGRL